MPYVSPIYLTDVEIVARYVRCETCKAPLVDPFPPRWPITLKGRLESATVTPHLPDCGYLESVRNGGEA